MKHIELELPLEITFRKHGIYFKCECEKYSLAYRSKESFEEAEKEMIEDIYLRIWEGGINIKLILKNK